MTEYYLRISSYIRKPFLIYDFATAPIWISLYIQYMRKIFFSFFIIVETSGEANSYRLDFKFVHSLRLRPEAESYNINSEHCKDTFSAEISPFRAEKPTFRAKKPTTRIRALKPVCLNLKTHPIFSVLTVVSRYKNTCLQYFSLVGVYKIGQIFLSLVFKRYLI